MHTDSANKFLTPTEVGKITKAALLHDIGMIVVAESAVNAQMARL